MTEQSLKLDEESFTTYEQLMTSFLDDSATWEQECKHNKKQDMDLIHAFAERRTRGTFLINLMYRYGAKGYCSVIDSSAYEEWLTRRTDFNELLLPNLRRELTPMELAFYASRPNDNPWQARGRDETDILKYRGDGRSLDSIYGIGAIKRDSI